MRIRQADDDAKKYDEQTEHLKSFGKIPERLLQNMLPSRDAVIYIASRYVATLSHGKDHFN